ncbi:DUF7537 family lipoprotein [Halocatena pleomorpha]|uniref:Uncharacterized protein n=1 Tax=Halocatena pleomorpha TaxID=1785090 RepID=A0A3P3R522_9EURY|nr:hypothetical protein [Halocatena pleomorpha]RRJ28058.1 hypothetical protein EIK79_16880 [Halocatena pleomorpha]
MTRRTNPNGDEYEAAGTVTRDGETLLRYNSTGGANPTMNTNEPVNSTLLIDEEGIIRQFTVTITHFSNSKIPTVTISYRTTDIDSTTVEKPDWVETARKQAN